MSVYSVATTADKGIFNLPKEVTAVDISTRNSYNATVIGYQAGEVNQGSLNVMLGYRAGQNTKFGSSNLFLGASSGEKNVNGNDNILIGTLAGRFLTNGSRNVVLGNNSATFLNGNNNIYVGFNNTIANVQPLSYCNVCVGYQTNIFGNNNISLGNTSYVFGNQTITLGNTIVDTTTNSIIVGANIINTGTNAFIINNRHNSNAIPRSFSNSENNYLNINDYIVVSKNSSNESVLRLNNDVIELASTRVSINLSGGSMSLGDVMQFAGKYSKLILDKDVTLGLSNTSNPNAPSLHITSNSIDFGGLNTQNISIYGSNTSMFMNSNIISLSNNFSELFLSSNLRIGGSNVVNFQAYATNASIYLNSNIINLSNNYVQATLNSENINIGGSNINSFTTFSKDASFVINSNIVSLSNNYAEININSNSIYFGGSNVDNMQVYASNMHLYLNSNVVTLSNNYIEASFNSNNIAFGGSNVDDIILYGSNTSLHLNPYVISLSNDYVEAYLDANTMLFSNNNAQALFDTNTINIGGTNNQIFRLYGLDNTITMSNGGTFLESDLTVYNNTYLSNNLFVNKTAKFYDNVDLYDDVKAYSNVDFQQDLYINSNSVIFVKQNVTFSNNDQLYFKGAGETQFLQPITTKCNVYVDTKMSFCNVQQRYVNWDNINEREVQELYGSTIVQKNLFVGGMMYSAGLNITDKLVLMSGTSNQWNQYVSITSNQNPYLVFQSSTGTVIKLGDDFQPELFNFTGKHRCSAIDISNINENFHTELIGKIVVASGDYRNLDNDAVIAIDEAVPMIELSDTSNDTRAFGVISAFESSDDEKRVFRLGNLHFETNKAIQDAKVIVNSVGEGGIWVCNENGNFKNGDLIVTSTLPGFGMKQTDDIVHSYTVAKITCDVCFDEDTSFNVSKSTNWKPTIETFTKKGTVIKISFVGCTYKF